MTSEGFCPLRRYPRGSACLNGLSNDPDRKTPPAGKLVGLKVTSGYASPRYDSGRMWFTAQNLTIR
jgi:hypothetical protein